MALLRVNAPRLGRKPDAGYEAVEAIPPSSGVAAGQAGDTDLDDFMQDVMRLSRHAVETGNFPPEVEASVLYSIQHKYRQGQMPSPPEFAALVDAYQQLERRLGPVNADTLRATEDMKSDLQKGRLQAPTSAAGQYVRTLQKRTYWNLALILVAHLLAEPSPASSENGIWLFLESVLNMITVIAKWVIPFAYGALGADAYILRRTTHKLSERQFDPRQIPEYRSRFLLGTVSGGVIVLFMSGQIAGATSPGITGAFSNLGIAALGFLAGYSNDFLFTTIERILGAILPKVADERHEPQQTPQPQLTQEERNQLRLVTVQPTVTQAKEPNGDGGPAVRASDDGSDGTEPSDDQSKKLTGNATESDEVPG